MSTQLLDGRLKMLKLLYLLEFTLRLQNYSELKLTVGEAGVVYA